LNAARLSITIAYSSALLAGRRTAALLRAGAGRTVGVDAGGARRAVGSAFDAVDDFVL